MFTQHRNNLIIFFLFLSLAGCSNLTTTSSTAHKRKRNDNSAQLTFTSKKYGFTLNYPASLKMSRTYGKSYLDSANWKTFAGQQYDLGTPVLSLALPTSNEVRAGELRIGISKNHKAIKNWDKLPDTARSKSTKHLKIDGVNFIVFKAGDAGMSHYLNVLSYRAVHHNICYAIDILIIGTNGQVYAPPRQPPFTKKYVWRQLKPVVASLKFFPPEPDGALFAPLPAIYTGTLPCADCPGIDDQLILMAEQRYTQKLDYQDRSAVFTNHGTWKMVHTDNRKILKLSSGQQWAIHNNGKQLRLLSQSGHEIKSKLNFDLKRTTKSSSGNQSKNVVVGDKEHKTEN